MHELHLWPHQSLTPLGFAGFIFLTFCLALFPLFPLLGTISFWGLLPFLMLTVIGLWIALRRSNHRAQILEILTLSTNQASLIRSNPDGDIQEWICNRYWANAKLHKKNGPIPNYVTLNGNGREVEIGAFLSETERINLFNELQYALRKN
ncbi:MAG: DUF2244 domain-containing protein [Aestuariivita sp.]|nr:DUF2244 domain-containing protein [Aestuariivita sp.]